MLCLAWTKRSQIYINTWFRVTWFVYSCIPKPLLNLQFHCFPLPLFNQLKSLLFSISYHFSCKHLISYSARIPLRTSEHERPADWSGRHTILILLAGKTFCAILTEYAFTDWKTVCLQDNFSSLHKRLKKVLNAERTLALQSAKQVYDTIYCQHIQFPRAELILVCICVSDCFCNYNDNDF